MSLDSKVILVSGGSRGLGQGIVRDLLRLGYRVATFSRSITPFIEECQKNDPQQTSFIWQAIDVTDYAKLKKFVMFVIGHYGSIDVLINNAGIGTEGVLALMRSEDIHKTISLNLEASINLTQICSRIMLHQQNGNIINISSIVGTRGFSGLAVYSATKAALDGFTRSLARELGQKGIRVNSIAPGYLETEMSHSLTSNQRAQIIRRTPLGRLGDVEDVLGTIRFLISSDSKFITGQVIVVDGGNTC